MVEPNPGFMEQLQAFSSSSTLADLRRRCCEVANEGEKNDQ
jgi:hypothetical protein